MPCWRCWPCSRGPLISSPRRWNEAWDGSGHGRYRACMRSRPAATGRRRSTVYDITADGRQALAAWLAEPGAGPVLECEALVKVAYADQGTRDGLLANLTALIDDATAKLHFGVMIATSYLEGRGPFQERLPLSGLMWRFLWEYHVTVLRWARWARDQVQAWPEDLSGLDVTEEFGRIVAAASNPWTARHQGGGV